MEDTIELSLILKQRKRLDGDCCKKNVIYQAEVITEDGRIEFYIGSTTQTFKGRFSGHRTSMNNPKYREKGSKLSKFIWELKDEGTNYQIKWRKQIQAQNQKMCFVHKRGLLYQLS